MNEGKLTLSEREREREREFRVAMRRFGSRHEKPCALPNVTTCALWECQVANRCKHSVALDRARVAARGAGGGEHG